MSLISNHTNQPKIKKGRGGRREGAGRPKGSITEATKARLQAETALKELARQYTSEAVQTLVDMMQDDATPPAARVAAVKEILDRGHGKATQVIAGDAENPLHIVNDIFGFLDGATRGIAAGPGVEDQDDASGSALAP